MSRLIDANNIKEAKFNNVPCVKTTPTDSELESYMRGWNDAIDAIAECEPTVDAVPVIRCKDCKHFHYDIPYLIQGIPVLMHEICTFWGNGCKTSENEFCSHAERRQDDEH